MSAHIAFPAFVRSLDPSAGLEAFRPASLSAVLNVELLRKRLGFNGVIVSDASEMAGLTSWCRAEDSKPRIIANGCDMILFSRAPEADMAVVAAAVVSGELPQARVTEALTRVLGLKAALGLHRQSAGPVAARKAALGTDANRAAARTVTARAPTLVKDVQALLPLSPDRHRRVLIYSGGIISPLHREPMEFALPQMLEREGFQVTLHGPDTVVTREKFDLILYLFGEETLLTRGRNFLDWAKVSGNFIAAMQRHWHDIPTAMICFGYPYYLYDAPRVPTYINA